ncbi:dTDP-glucose 4,6-dehydratase [Candidatus Woesearchaeota archaeon]|nr:dTDP-glucose 4,6-dehydratase [Nanoarchaeota archaeon]MCB9370771.1 dTDP-glucose 4,6-dehydratase [Candidatus Woesearchaeota archaeon]USN43847.1 MAG: dTDP-glucose 4,6-dehydratase [Candidatus Woesearchaeota archaeon]
MKILVTGGAGFIGSAFTRYFVKKYPEHEIVVFDKLTYAGNLDNLKEVSNSPNFRFVRGDVCNLELLEEVLKDCDVVVHFAAESHVDASIGNSLCFTMTNAYGTHVLLEAARTANIKKFIHISTDEVYGDILKGSFKEEDKLSPNNPYSASKAAAEMIVSSYMKTYKMPICIVRGNNNYGPYQYPEKLISLFSVLLLQDKKVPLYNPKPVRTFIHVDDMARAVDVILQKGKIFETYNIGTKDEYSCLEVTKKLLKLAGKNHTYIQKVEDRAVNDRRYSVHYKKLTALGWKPEISFDEGLAQTFAWYKENGAWWKKILRNKK